MRTLEVPGLGLSVRLWGKRPRGAVAPLVLHLHGGTFASRDGECGAQFAQLLVNAGAVVGSLDYPLAPQHRFPEQLEAGYATLEWLYRQRARLAGTDAPVFVAGEEAGGNLAAGLAMMVRDRAHPPLAGQVLVAPMLDPCAATPSLREVMGDETHCKWAEGWQLYLRGPMDAEHPYAVPGRAQRLAGLAPALILTAGDDPFRDEASAYARRLAQAGVPVRNPVLEPATGWPESLACGAFDACPCAEVVERELRAFLHAPPIPPPS
ncbi:MAG TPA: alpha/beta hydrolase [Ramlibacter sp.]|nr:alpha/beta hydrolase [Ramlibacter sp.]